MITFFGQNHQYFLKRNIFLISANFKELLPVFGTTENGDCKSCLVGGTNTDIDD
jgi:hypothetical protein